MKTKVILLIAISAVITLSFTFASSKRAMISPKTSASSSAAEAPVGGFVIEDKF